jgi:hypothetical protein
MRAGVKLSGSSKTCRVRYGKMSGVELSLLGHFRCSHTIAAPVIILISFLPTGHSTAVPEPTFVFQSTLALER